MPCSEAVDDDPYPSSAAGNDEFSYTLTVAAPRLADADSFAKLPSPPLEPNGSFLGPVRCSIADGGLETAVAKTYLENRGEAASAASSDESLLSLPESIHNSNESRFSTAENPKELVPVARTRFEERRGRE